MRGLGSAVAASRPPRPRPGRSRRRRPTAGTRACCSVRRAEVEAPVDRARISDCCRAGASAVAAAEQAVAVVDAARASAPATAPGCRAAASSIASGMPVERDGTSRATASAFSAVELERAGRADGARSTKSVTDSYCSSARAAAGARRRAPTAAAPEKRPPRDPERLPAGGQHLEVRAGPGAGRDQLGARVDQVLAVVQDQQHVPVGRGSRAEQAERPTGRPAPGDRGRRRRCGREARVVQVGQLDEAMTPSRKGAWHRR